MTCNDQQFRLGVITFGLRGHNRRRSAGFTLVEVLVSSILLGIIVVTMMQAFAQGTQMLEQSDRITVGVTVAEQIHELSLTLSLTDPHVAGYWGPEPGEGPNVINDLDDLSDRRIRPPIASDGTVWTDLADYEQRVTVVNVAESDFEQVVGNGLSSVYRVTVVVLYREEEVARLSWLIIDGSWSAGG